MVALVIAAASASLKRCAHEGEDGGEVLDSTGAGWQVEALHEALVLSLCDPFSSFGSLEADKGPHAPVFATINLC